MTAYEEQPTVEALLTADDVCALLKVKKSWLYDTVENGLLRPIRLGKQLRFRPASIARFLDECENDREATRAQKPGAGSRTG
jgi:excisionase family DNA binding protein